MSDMTPDERYAMLEKTVEVQCDEMFDNLYSCYREHDAESHEMVSAVENLLGSDMAKFFKQHVGWIEKQGRQP
jgi:hypothetical protein